MKKSDIYFRWIISLCAFLGILGYQALHPETIQTEALPQTYAVESEAAASAAPAPAAASSEAAASESSSAAASSELPEADSSSAPSTPEPADMAAASSESSSSLAASSKAAASSGSSSSSQAASSSKAASSKPASSSSQSVAASAAAPANAEPAAPASSSSEASTPRGPYNDGVYSGQGKGFGGTISVSVTIANGYISSVDVTSADGEDKPYLKDAKQVISKVISSQSTNQDAISGATSSTWGILDAIDDALKGAK